MASEFKTRVQRVLGHVTKHLGEDAIFYPCKGASFSVRLVFDNEFEIVDPNTDTVISSNAPVILIRLSDFPNGVVENDQFSLEGKRFKVWSVQEDGQGGARCNLHRMT